MCCALQYGDMPSALVYWTLTLALTLACTCTDDADAPRHACSQTTPLVISMSAHGANSMGVGASISAHRRAPSSATGIMVINHHQYSG